ncbi:unnamed protein product, partial [Brachionus calyciflorus]
YLNNERNKFYWNAYLLENNVSGVPFDIFSEGDVDQTNLQSCTSIPNSRLKIMEFESLIDKYWNEILEKNIVMKKDSQSIPFRGLILLPKNFNDLVKIKRNGFFDNLYLHMTCMIKTNDKYCFCHLLDSDGVLIDNKLMDINDLVAILISTFLMIKSQLPTIILEKNQIFSNQPDNLSELELSNHVRNYLKKFLINMSLILNKNDLINQTYNLNIKKYLNLLDRDLNSSEIYQFQKNLNQQSSHLAKCYFCHLADLNYNSKNDQGLNLSQKITKYSKFCTRFMLVAYEETSIDLDNRFAELFPNIRTLLLINPTLKIVEDSIFTKFIYLNQLRLINNNLQDIPRSILNLENLKSLAFNNELISDNLNFENMINLQTLEIKNIEMKNTTRVINLPNCLRSLKVSNSSFSHFCFNLNKESIQEFELKGIPLLDLYKYSKNDSLISLENLISGFEGTLLIKKEQIKKLFEFFDSNSNGYLDLNEIVKFNAFIFKKYNRLGPQIPSIIFEMINLKTLELSYQAIEEIPDEIENLKNLKNLILNNCILLKSISPKLANMALEKLNLFNCLALKNPPPEIVKRGMNSIMTFLRRLLSGSIEFKRTKLMLVGLGEAGKTSLLSCLKEEILYEKPNVTDGININDWVVNLEDNSTLTFSMWDFAGQSVYYNTHQFFLSSRGVYLLVWNVRLGSEYAGLEFWLSSISCHAPGAPIFVVGTHTDQVSKYSLDKEDLKSRFKQIVGFHFVSSYTYDGIEELRNAIIKTTLQEKYIGEKIPKVWLDFEQSIKEKSQKESLVPDYVITSLAEKCGIYDNQEIIQAIKFLSDLGSVQYFENQSLKNKVVINPQWIVDAFSKIVSVKETCIQDGKFTHDKIAEIWKDYEPSLHEWMLKLTEEFDLTFSIPDKNLTIVPCLLSETEPKIEWPEIDHKSPIKIKQFKVTYNFDYLPIGLFNRIQVRLFQYADNSLMWKKGSLLNKNSHLALISQSKNALSIQIKVQGVKPENIVYVIHETIEILINEYFNGLKYDFSFPCPECVESQTNEPYLFSSSLLIRANEMKAPFLQCCKYFHAVSLQEMSTIMPLDDSSNLDLNLEYSIRDLKQLKNSFKYDILFWHCVEDCKLDNSKSINPLTVIESIKSHGFKVWYTTNPNEGKFDQITSIIKQSKLIIFGISDNFSQDEKCVQIFEMVKNLIKRNYLLIEFGLLGKRDWLKNPLFASACTDFRVIMQDPKRFQTKLADAFESIEKMIQTDIKEENEKKKSPDVFISYCWANSHDALRKGSKGTKTSLGWLDPRELVKFFANHGIHAWIDIDNLDSTKQMFGEITKGINQAKCIVACISDEYVESLNCKLEFRFAHISLKIPIIKAIVGLGNEWRKNEIAFLGSCYPEVNFQLEAPGAYSALLNHVKHELEKSKATETDEISNENTNLDTNNSAFQELYELTQRKFLRQLINFSDKVPTIRPYPRLFCMDLVDEEIIEKLIKMRITNLAIDKGEKIREEKSIDENIETKVTIEPSEDIKSIKNLITCIRPMCEHDESWHFSDSFVILPNLTNSFCPYLIRIMTILKNGNLSNELAFFMTESGSKLMSEMEDKSNNEPTEMTQSYNSLRNYFISEYENGRFYSNSDTQTPSTNLFNLNKCELKNGKILWLCKKHAEQTNAKILSDQKNSGQNQLEQEKNKLIEELEKVKIDIF